MAATIAEATGFDTGRTKTTHRLGSRAAETTAATWHTFAKARVEADGSAVMELTRNGRTIIRSTLSAEAAPAGGSVYVAGLGIVAEIGPDPVRVPAVREDRWTLDHGQLLFDGQPMLTLIRSTWGDGAVPAATLTQLEERIVAALNAEGVKA